MTRDRDPGARRDPRGKGHRGSRRHRGLPLGFEGRTGGGGGAGAEEPERDGPEEPEESVAPEHSAHEQVEQAPDEALLPLESLTTEQLTRELKRRQSLLGQLTARRGRLLRQLKDLDDRIAQLGGSVQEVRGVTAPGRAAGGGPKRSRARNPVSLPDAIAMAVEVRATITPTEAAQLVLRNGYRSTSKNFGMMVANALAKDPRFRRVSRGVYERVK
jgi:hypothetical protein